MPATGTAGTTDRVAASVMKPAPVIPTMGLSALENERGRPIWVQAGEGGSRHPAAGRAEDGHPVEIQVVEQFNGQRSAITHRAARAERRAEVAGAVRHDEAAAGSDQLLFQQHRGVVPRARPMKVQDGQARTHVTELNEPCWRVVALLAEVIHRGEHLQAT